MLKLAFVTPIFSTQTYGGAERHAREFAELLAEDFEIDIITTTAIDYRTWKNQFPVGTTYEKNLKVHRFPIKKQRSIFFSFVNHSAIQKQTHLKDIEFENWLVAQGPYSPDLVEFVKNNQQNYDLFFCFTYLYYPIVKSIPYIKEKVVCILTLHDEAVAYFPQFKKIYTNEIFYCFNVLEEKKLYEKIFGYSPKNFRIVGMNLSPIKKIPNPYSHYVPYILYIGRIDKGKGVEELIQYFLEWKNVSKSSWNLIFVGKGSLHKKYAFIQNLGFVSEEKKLSLIAGSQLIVNPSQYESFSIAIMEAWLCSKPVLVNGNSEVLKNHCIRSNGGLFYFDKEGFISCLEFLYKNFSILNQMGQNGKEYVEKNYDPSMVKKKLLNIIHEKLFISNSHLS